MSVIGPLRLACESSLDADLLQAGRARCCGAWQAGIFQVADLVLILGSAPHGQPGSARCWCCRDALPDADAARQHRHLAEHTQVSSWSLETSCQRQRRARQPLTHMPNAHFAASLRHQGLCGVPGPTSASQLAARKKGVEKRSLLLTTLCSVDLKRPFVHLQRIKGNQRQLATRHATGMIPKKPKLC